MLSVTVPKDVRLVSDRIKDLYDTSKYCFINTIVAYFMFNMPSVSETQRSFAFAVYGAQFTRELKKFKPNRLLRRARKKALKIAKAALDPNDFIFAIDDTANPKYGRNMKGVGLWGGSSGVYKGQKIVCIVMVNLKTKKVYPLDYRFCEKNTDFTALDLAVGLVKSLVNEGFPKFGVVTDSWFSSVELMGKIEALGCDYIGEIKRNRKVKSNPSPNVQWTSLAESFSNTQRERVKTEWDNPRIQKRINRRKLFAQKILQIKKRSKPIKIVAMYNRRNSRKAFAYYLSTNRSLSGARIWLLSRARWKIECVFRSCKQYFSFGNLSCDGENASHLAVEMPLFLYLLLALEPEKFGFTESDTIDSMALRIRRRSIQSTMKLLLFKPQNPQVEELRQRLKAA